MCHVSDCPAQSRTGLVSFFWGSVCPWVQFDGFAHEQWFHFLVFMFSLFTVTWDCGFSAFWCNLWRVWSLPCPWHVIKLSSVGVFPVDVAPCFENHFSGKCPYLVVVVIVFVCWPCQSLLYWASRSGHLLCPSGALPHAMVPGRNRALIAPWTSIVDYFVPGSFPPLSGFFSYLVHSLGVCFHSGEGR